MPGDSPSHSSALEVRPGDRRVDRALVVLGLVLGLYVVVYPFTRVTYPPITDLPFHAANASILRHYLDPAFHLREQFTLHPLEAPYVSMYALGALFAFVVPIAVAAKLMAIAMLALVPLGFLVLCLGMKKSPLWALASLGLVWSTVTQWGFFAFVGAIGLFLMSTGCALLVVDDPTPRRRAALAATLVAIHFTHVFRVPHALMTTILVGVLAAPSRRHFRALLLPLAPAVALFLLWIALRPRELAIGLSDLGFHPERVRDLPKHLFGAYMPFDGAPPTREGNAERAISVHMLLFALVAAGASIGAHLRSRGASPGGDRTRTATHLSALVAAILFLGYLTLPYEAGSWFYVYPREIVPCVLFLLAALPDLPRTRAAKIGFSLLFALGTGEMSAFVARRFREFEANTADFREILPLVPRAPRLFYLVYWLGGSAKRATPFLHLPAWIQAEKGGALDFHLVRWNQYPIRYRTGSADVPPVLPERFEWTPEQFQVLRHGPWFDTFLVRHRIDPSELFAADPTVRLVARRGTFWLYERTPKAGAPAPN